MLCSFPEQLPPTAPLRRRSSRPCGRRDSPSPATRQVPTACLSCSHFRRRNRRRRAYCHQFPSGIINMMRNKKGFTLIELLIVVVIIGILAAIAIPKFANTKDKAYLASMKSDLRNLVTAEEAYFADSVKYTAAYGAGGVNFVQSTGNTTPAISTTA